MAQFILLSLLLATIQLPLVSTDGIYFNKEAKSWIDAFEHCNNTGSFLVALTDDAMWDTVETHLINQSADIPDGAWIGLERSIFAVNDITWSWVSGGKIESGSHWDKSFPINEFNYHCGKIIQVANGYELKLLDDSCHKKLPFICQM